MKKLLTALLFAGSFATAAAQGTFHFGVLDEQTTPPTLNASDSIQRSKNEAICWAMKGYPAYTTFNIKEHFQAPAGSFFDNPDAIVESNSAATEHTLSYTAQTNAEGTFVQCWRFGQSDPLGLYIHTLTINDEVTPSNQFQLNR